MVGPDGEVLRIVGSLSDITETKTSEERLLHDAVHDNLTGLPNRELFFDRLGAALAMAQSDPRSARPSSASTSTASSRSTSRSDFPPGDSILLTMARRLGRILKPQDTLARLSGDQFAALIVSETGTEQIIALAECRPPRRLDAGDLQRQGNSAHRLDRRRALRPAIASPSARTC